jgi:hypothetical protein
MLAIQPLLLAIDNRFLHALQPLLLAVKPLICPTSSARGPVFSALSSASPDPGPASSALFTGYLAFLASQLAVQSLLLAVQPLPQFLSL